MSNKDRKRAEKEGTVHRNGKLVQAGKDGKPVKCAFPRCSNNAWPKSEFGLCQTCDYVIHLVGWFDRAMEEVEKQKGKEPVLLVPKPGMSETAMKEAIEAAKKSGAKGIAVIGREKP